MRKNAAKRVDGIVAYSVMLDVQSPYGFKCFVNVGGAGLFNIVGGNDGGDGGCFGNRLFIAAGNADHFLVAIYLRYGLFLGRNRLR